MSKMMQIIRSLIWFIFVFVVVIELVVPLRLLTVAVSLTLEQLAVLTIQMFWLAIFDKLLIVALFGTFVFEKQDKR